MPCYSLRSTSIDLSALGKIDRSLLVKALEALGMRNIVMAQDGNSLTSNLGTLDLKTGTLQSWGYNGGITADKIKQSYGAQVVQATAKKYGWKLQQTGEFKYAIAKG